MTDANPEAGEVYLAGRIDWEIGDLTASPFLSWQENVLGAYGLRASYDLPLQRSGKKTESWFSEWIVCYYDNQVPRSVEPDYEDLWVTRIFTGYRGEVWSLGGGLFWMGNGVNDTKAGLFDSFDPLKEDNLDPFNEQNHTYLFYLKSGIDFGRLKLEPAVGAGRNFALEADTFEFDFFFSYELSAAFRLEGYAVYTDYQTDELPSYTVVGASLAYAF